MQKQRFLLFIMVLFANTASYSQLNELEFLVTSIEKDIIIDGISNEKEWDKAKWQSEFWLWRPNDSLKADKQTRFKILKNEKNLYILIE